MGLGDLGREARIAGTDSYRLLDGDGVERTVTGLTSGKSYTCVIKATVNYYAGNETFTSPAYGPAIPR